MKYSNFILLTAWAKNHRVITDLYLMSNPPGNPVSSVFKYLQNLNNSYYHCCSYPTQATTISQLDHCSSLLIDLVVSNFKKIILGISRILEGNYFIKKKEKMLHM